MRIENAKVGIRVAMIRDQDGGNLRYFRRHGIPFIFTIATVSRITQTLHGKDFTAGVGAFRVMPLPSGEISHHL